MERIADISRNEQTDELKVELFNLVRQFVLKNWRAYYAQYRGHLDDLVYDIYAEFLTPKSREKGKEESLLDKWDPTRLPLPALVKVSVIRKLIDRSRSDKGERTYREEYDEETGELSLNWLAGKIAEKSEEALDDFQFSDEELKSLKNSYRNLSEEGKKRFNRLLKHYSKDLNPYFKSVFDDLVYSDVTVSDTKPKPDFDDYYIKELSDDIIDVRTNPLKGTPAVKITFKDSNSLKDYYATNKDEIDELMKEYYYKFYTAKGPNAYYKKMSDEEKENYINRV